MRTTPPLRVWALAALAALAVLPPTVRAADPQPPAGPTPDYGKKIEELEQQIRDLKNSTQDLRKDTRKLEVSAEESAKLKPIAGYDNGFFIQSPDGANKLVAGGYVHFDGRYFTNSGDQGTTQFLFRRARLELRGKFLKYYEFRFLPDFAGGQVVIQDAYLNVNYVPWARLQAGKYKEPVGLDDPSKAARKAKAWAIGVNWSLNRMVRLMLDFDRTDFTGGAKNGGDRKHESVIMSRVQFVI